MHSARHCEAAALISAALWVRFRWSLLRPQWGALQYSKAFTHTWDDDGERVKTVESAMPSPSYRIGLHLTSISAVSRLYIGR